MLRNWNKPEKPDGAELDERLEAARIKLRVQQMLIKERKIPVFVLFEGWGTAPKRRRGNPFYIVTLLRFQRQANFVFWILAGWMRLQRAACMVQ